MSAVWNQLLDRIALVFQNPEASWLSLLKLMHGYLEDMERLVGDGAPVMADLESLKNDLTKRISPQPSHISNADTRSGRLRLMLPPLLLQCGKARTRQELKGALARLTLQLNRYK